MAYDLVDNSGSDHQGGVIRNNFVYLHPGLMSAGRKARSDGQIVVSGSPTTKGYCNTTLTNGNVMKSIEFRFSSSGAEARNNLANAPIDTRDGASFSPSRHLLTATASFSSTPALQGCI
jgi:hypothetical protein